MFCHNEGHKIVAVVELEWAGRVWRGTSQDADTWRAGAVVTARAALGALEELAARRVAFSLEALDSVRSFDRQVTVAHVHMLAPTRRLKLVGCAQLGDDTRHAAARATLSAVNRVLPNLLLISAPSV